jgi:hypothetical protein
MSTSNRYPNWAFWAYVLAATASGLLMLSVLSLLFLGAGTVWVLFLLGSMAATMTLVLLPLVVYIRDRRRRP